MDVYMENDQKIEPLLLLSFDATADERSKSPELSYGTFLISSPAPALPSDTIPAEELIWEIIFSYTESYESLVNTHPTIDFRFLISGYGIARGSKEDILMLSSDPQMIYIEKPKRLFFETYHGRQVSCINSAQSLFPDSLTGQGVLVGIIDSGIDYAHPDFRNPDGTTRISLLWDQVLGEVFSSETINRALQASSEAERYDICPSVDISGHGTHVAGIAAGNGAASAGVFRGVAYEATYIIVKLGVFNSTGFPGTAQLMEAVDFCITESMQLQMPLALNLSFGNTYGSHSGTSLLETFLNQISNHSRLSICVGSGNEGVSGGHTNGILPVTSPASDSLQLSPVSPSPTVVEFAISEFSTSLSIQIWKNYEDDFSLSIYNPASDSSILISEASGTARYHLGDTTLLVFYGEPAPYSIYQEILFEFIPDMYYLDSGIWSITLLPRQIRSGEWEMWMPAAAVRNTGTRFLLPTPDTTLTIPSTAAGVITVGAYDSATDAIASFSGRGYTYGTDQPKPDLVAPGVEITSCAPGGGYTELTGTSMATPFVTGSCAALMQWGIVNGNDPFLYGEKVKARLRRGARKLPGTQEHPNPQSGWGALCLRNSLPK